MIALTFDDCAVEHLGGDLWRATARLDGNDDPDGARAEFTMGRDLDVLHSLDDQADLHATAQRFLAGRALR